MKLEKKGVEFMEWHDSVILEMMYNHSEHKLRFIVELCEYMQPDYEEATSELQLGELIFLGVQYANELESIPLFSKEENIDGQIVQVQFFEGEKNNISKCSFVISLEDYTQRQNTLVSFEFDYKEAIWTSLP